MILGSPAPIDVQRELAAMRAELAEIRVAQREEWIDRERAKELRAVVADALADSATRASFATDGATTGYADGAFIRSGDGNWMFKVGVMTQVRFVYNNASNQPEVDNRWGMETHRVNLTLSGTVIDPTVQWLALASYNSQPDRFVEKAQEVLMQYAWISKDFGDGFSGTVGLQNVPWDIESTFYGSSKITAGEYSIFNYRFGTGKNTGVTGKYQCDSWRVTGGTFSQLDVRSTSWDAASNLSYAFAMTPSGRSAPNGRSSSCNPARRATSPACCSGSGPSGRTAGRRTRLRHRRPLPRASPPTCGPRCPAPP